jgi:ubiquinone/menaquinone biosynthesis C-methylase UbiE
MGLNASRVWLDRELTAFGESLPEGCLVLDAGAGSQAYAPKFSKQRYESADFEQVEKKYKPSTYVCDLRKIPVEDGRFDAIVFTQVMEHVPEPKLVLQELHRVLKPGGKMFFSAPLYYPEHEQPYDYYRYTQFGLRYLFDETGFEIGEIRWLEGFLATVAHQLRHMRGRFPKTPSGYGGGIVGVFLLVFFQLFGLVARFVSPFARYADIRKRYTDKGLPINYMAILTKPVA